jgi:hypothetical protein
MKINNKVLSIPPYISTTWNHVSAIRMQGSVLVINLYDGTHVEIPNLSAETIELIFNLHVSFADQGPSQMKLANPFAQLFLGPQPGQTPDSSMRLGFSSIDEVGAALQHNPQLANSPDLPPEILRKIAAITKIIAPEDVQALPKPEPHCNCMFCQIARAVQQANPTPQVTSSEQATPPHPEDEVKEHELSFQQWEIQQLGDQLFNVVNKLDPKEKYSVYLGNPVGCTCGKPGCEHIIAVLKS